MQIWLPDPCCGPAQGWRNPSELWRVGLTTIIGLGRTIQGRVAGMRAQTIVGTSSALILLISKYGFGESWPRQPSVGPSRVAARSVSGIGFLGDGIIITRRGAVAWGSPPGCGVWESAAIGTAAGAGLFDGCRRGGPALCQRRWSSMWWSRELRKGCAERSAAHPSTKAPGCAPGKYCRAEAAKWQLNELDAGPPWTSERDQVGVMKTLSGAPNPATRQRCSADIDGVSAYLAPRTSRTDGKPIFAETKRDRSRG